MYGNSYGYRTGLNLDMVNHMKNKAKKLNRYLIGGNKTIVDIGSNDGTFLNFFKDSRFKLIGIDPTIKKFKNFYKKK
jgi:hypothetical protein